VTLDHDAISHLGLHVDLPSSTCDLDPGARTPTGSKVPSRTQGEP
jgi:hypothetical protein